MAQKKFLTLPDLETTLEAFVEGDELEGDELEGDELEGDELEGDELELDEIWSFVKRRKNKRWIWLALCRRTRQVVAFAIGNRGQKTCRTLWKAIPDAYKKAHCFADIWEAYAKVIAASQLTQSHSKATPKPLQSHSKATPKPLQSHSKATPKPLQSHSKAGTNHIERFNGTLRQRLGRLVRETFSFSKTDHMHPVVLSLFLHAYNRSKLST